MTTLGTSIDTTIAPDPYAPDSVHHIATLSDGNKFIVYLKNGVSTYQVVSPTGTVVTAAASMTTNHLSATGYAVVPVANSIYLLSVSSVTVSIQHFDYNITSHAVTASSVSTKTLSNTPTVFDAIWDSTNSHFLIAWAAATSHVNIQLITATGGTASGGTSNLFATLNPNRVRWSQVSQTATTAYITVSDPTNGFYLAPVTVSTGVAGAIERPFNTRIDDHDTMFDASGYLDIVVYQSTAQSLSTVKRTGTGTYTGSVALVSSTGNSTGSFALAYSSANGNLWLMWISTVNQPNGEVYVMRRTSSGWGTAQVLVGGDANGYRSVSAGRFFDSTTGAVDLLYVYGTGGGATNALYYAQVAAAGALNTATGLTPSGSYGSASPPVPVFGYTATPALGTGDTQGAREIQVELAATPFTVKWDSGKVASSAQSGITYGGTSNAGDSNYVAPVTLVLNTQYQFRVRTWDTITQTVSAWSAWQTFTPVSAPVPTITSINAPSGGTNYTASGTPITLTSTSFDINFSVTDASGVNLQSVTPMLYDSTGTVLIDTGATVTINAAEPYSGTLTYTPSNIANSTSYLVALRAVNANGIIGTYGPTVGTWQLNTSYTPPGVATGFTITPDPVNGWVVLAWTNASGVVQTSVYYRLSATAPGQGGVAGPWLVQSSGSLLTGITLLPPINVPVDYAVVGYSTVGIASAYTTILNQTLGLWGNYGIWYNNVLQPRTKRCVFGGTEDWQSASSRDQTNNPPRAYVPAGRPAPIKSYDNSSWFSTRTRKYFVENQTTVSGVAYDGVAQKEQLRQMCAPPHTPVLYRDPDGNRMVVDLATYHDEHAPGGVDFIVTFDYEQVDYPNPVTA